MKFEKKNLIKQTRIYNREEGSGKWVEEKKKNSMTGEDKNRRILYLIIESIGEIKKMGSRTSCLKWFPWAP